MAEPVVSVLVPTYQHGPYIRQCLDGILAQHLNVPWEVVIGEDGSTDGTREICLEYARSHPGRIRVLLNDRKDVVYIEGSPTGRRNVIQLYRAAKGAFIALCEGDDVWNSPDKLQTQLDHLRTHPEAVGCYHDTVVIDEHGTRSHSFREKLPARFTRENIISYLSAFHVSSVFFRNLHQFDHVPGWYWKVGVFDMVLFNLLVSKGELHYCAGLTSSYRKQAAGITNRDHNVNARLHLHRMVLWLRSADTFGVFPEEQVTDIVAGHFTLVVKEHGRPAALNVLKDLFLLAGLSLMRRPRLWARVLGALRTAPRV